MSTSVLIRKVAGPEEGSALFCDLSTEEKQRADRFVSEPARLLFITGRHLLRSTLAELMQLKPAGVPIEIADNGKPFVALRQAPAFNLSHTDGFVALATTGSQTVGIDIEKRDPHLDEREIEGQVLTCNEQRWLNQSGDRKLAFLQLWTLKEALIKADGRGFGLDPRTLEINQSPNGWVVSPPPTFRVPNPSALHVAVGAKFVVAVAGPEDIGAEIRTRFLESS